VYDIPPDPERPRVIRLYLQMQIAAVDAKIQKIEAGAVGSARGRSGSRPLRF
jgi:hypothetical protein